MGIQDLIFRVFVSSTFSDLVAERNALQERVFPRLSKFCQKHGARFQAIDLRWGVSEEASLDQQAMSICLQELKRCQEYTPRPNFILLLGDRYGWRPLPESIPAHEYQEIEHRLSGTDEAALLTTWYKRDDNALYEFGDETRQGIFVLQPRAGRFAEYDAWDNEVQRPLHAALQRAVRGMELTSEARLKYEASATHQEIFHGALQVRDTINHAFGFFRTIQELPQDASAWDFVDLNEHNRPDRFAQERLRSLKAELRDRLPNLIHDYHAEWRQGAITTDHIGTLPADLEACNAMLADGYEPRNLCEAVWCRLGRVMLEEVQRRDRSDPVDQEVIAHRAFRQDRSRRFIGRDELPSESELHERFLNSRIEIGKMHALVFTGTANTLQKIDRYIASPRESSLLLLCAEYGTGATALMALAAKRAHEQIPFVHVITRFIGATPKSKDGKLLLVELCGQLGLCYGEQNEPVATEEQELFAEFQKRLRLAVEKVPVVLFLDAVEELIGSDAIRTLDWLPAELPVRAYVIISIHPSECLPAIKAKSPEQNHVHVTVDAISRERVAELLDDSLHSAKRTLQNEQRTRVLQEVNDAIMTEGIPLYDSMFQKFAFEEVKQWHSYQDVPSYNGKVGFASNFRGILSDIVWRLAQKHDEVLVARCFGYLAASRCGLAEDELLNILSSDLDVYERFFRSTFHPPPDLVTFVRKHLPELCPDLTMERFSTPDDDTAVISVLSNMRQDNVRLRSFLARILSEPDGPHLPIVIWARLHFDLAPYLSERMVDGTHLLFFFHRSFASFIEDEFISLAEKRECHRRLTDYFLRQPLWIAGKEGPVLNSRRSSELEYQQRALSVMEQ
jgi:NACHT domain- and WD repeat-containing protein